MRTFNVSTGWSTRLTATPARAPAAASRRTTIWAPLASQGGRADACFPDSARLQMTGWKRGTLSSSLGWRRIPESAAASLSETHMVSLPSAKGSPAGLRLLGTASRRLPASRRANAAGSATPACVRRTPQRQCVQRPRLTLAKHAETGLVSVLRRQYGARDRASPARRKTAEEEGGARGRERWREPGDCCPVLGVTLPGRHAAAAAQLAAVAAGAHPHRARRLRADPSAGSGKSCQGFREISGCLAGSRWGNCAPLRAVRPLARCGRPSSSR